MIVSATRAERHPAARAAFARIALAIPARRLNGGQMIPRVHVLALAVCLTSGGVFAQNNRIDVVSPSAPELAAYGKYAIGVRTIQVTDRSRPDILNTKEGGATARYDRTLTLDHATPVK
jgi:hypothetical protein